MYNRVLDEVMLAEASGELKMMDVMLRSSRYKSATSADVGPPGLAKISHGATWPAAFAQPLFTKFGGTWAIGLSLVVYELAAGVGPAECHEFSTMMLCFAL